MFFSISVENHLLRTRTRISILATYTTNREELRSNDDTNRYKSIIWVETANIFVPNWHSRFDSGCQCWRYSVESFRIEALCFGSLCFVKIINARRIAWYGKESRREILEEI